MIVHLPHLFIYLSPLELLDLFISSINYLTFPSTSLPLSLSHILNSLTFSSPQLITSLFHLPLSHSHLLNSLTSSSPQLIAPPISYLNPMLRFFFSFHVVLWFYCCLSLKGAFFSLWFLIGFAGFHAFIYLFIWFFCYAQYFYFLAFGVLCSIGFIIL
jgi:hypothetical protein